RGLDDEANRVFIAGRYRDVRIGGIGGGGAGGHRPRRRHPKLAKFPGGNGGRDGDPLGTANRGGGGWAPGGGRDRRKIILPFFHLHRPLREYAGFLLCAAWCAALIYSIVTIATSVQAGTATVSGVVGYGLLLAFAFGFVLALLRHAMRIFFDQLF